MFLPAQHITWVAAMQKRTCDCDCADFCQQQLQDIVALTGHVNEAASTKYSVSTEGKRVFKCHVASKPIKPCCNHLSLHSLMHCSQQDAQYSGVHVFLKDQHTL